MKQIIKYFSVIAFMAILSSNVLAQSHSDFVEGNFTVPSYSQGDWEKRNYEYYCVIKFSDGESGKVWKNEDCANPYAIVSRGYNEHYPSLAMAIKALYCQLKTGGSIMDGKVDCE